MMLMESDEILAQKAAQGSDTAFRRVLERNYELIYRVAYRFFGQAADAEDVAQEICLGLARKIRSFRGEASFSTWLYAVTLNGCRDHARRRKSHRHMPGVYMQVADHRAADWADSDAKARWLYRAIDGLDPALKETVLLVLAEDMTHRQAGEVLGVKESTISWRMHEAKKKLKAMAQHD
jgi:RNA polymerase sigma-70 factor, ECF subfamily